MCSAANTSLVEVAPAAAMQQVSHPLQVNGIRRPQPLLAPKSLNGKSGLMRLKAGSRLAAISLPSTSSSNTMVSLCVGPWQSVGSKVKRLLPVVPTGVSLGTHMAHRFIPLMQRSMMKLITTLQSSGGKAQRTATGETVSSDQLGQ